MSRLRTIMFGLFISSAAVPMPVYAAGSTGGAVAGGAGSAGIGPGSTAPNPGGAPGTPGNPTGPATVVPGQAGTLPGTPNNPANGIVNPATGQPYMSGVAMPNNTNAPPCNNAGVSSSGGPCSPASPNALQGTTNTLPATTSGGP
jgi:hypothetical protein